MSEQERAAKRQKKSDNNQDDEEERQEAAWRLDPTKTYSDFIIKITCKEDGMVDYQKDYHVHKIMLMHHGAHKSDYFVAALRDGGQFSESNEISIELQDTAAAHAFPLFLDFLYTGRINRQLLSLQEAILLIHLGDRFTTPKLVEEMNDVLLDRLNLDNLADCLPIILSYQADPSMKRAYWQAVHWTMQAIFERSDKLQELVKGMDTKFAILVILKCHKIIAGYNIVKKTNDCYTSTFAAHFLAYHKETITKKELEEITYEKCMPQVAPEVALKLLEVEFDVVGDALLGEDLTSLQKRCCVALSQQMSISGYNVEESKRIFEKFPKPLMVNLMVYTLSGPDKYSFPTHAGDQSNFTGRFVHNSNPKIEGIKCLKWPLEGENKHSSWVVKRPGPDEEILWNNPNGSPCENSRPPAWGWHVSTELKMRLMPIFILYHKNGEVPKGFEKLN